jgi:hypothetical protein
MFQGFARCLMVAGLSSAALVGCSDDPVTPPGGAGTGSGGSAAGAATGGTSSAGMSSAGMSSAGMSSAGMSSAGTSSAGTSMGGSGGTTSTGGSSTGGSSGSSTGGSGGSSTGGGGGSGGSGGGTGMPTAVANITGLSGKVVTGTATFTQGATMTTLVLNLTACPAGAHASHLHETKNCGDEGNAAGGHWVPNGEGLTDYTCADNKGMLTYMKPTSMWTVGDGSATDVTKYSFIVHEMGGASPGGRIGCGLINKQ